MRFKLPFSDVSSIVELSSTDIELPENIVFAQGDTRGDLRADATRILLTKPNVNTVIMLEPQRDMVGEAVKQLDAVAFEKRLSTKHDMSNGLPAFGVHNNLKDYLDRRSRNLGNPLLDDDLMQAAGDAASLWYASVHDADQIEGTFLSQSIITYVPDYIGSRTKPGAHINAHIDAAKSTNDMRIVECAQGSGTILFDDNDFVYMGGDGLSLIKTNITCWSLVQGSSVAIRTPSTANDRMGAKPSIHAHGIGQEDDTPEQRLTTRHDLVFE